jgi:hypothetical protein
MERTYQGLRARWPSYGPTDALPYMFRDRRLVQGRDEPRAAANERLITFLDTHPTRGSPFALHNQIRAFLGVDVMVRTVDTRGNWYTTAADGTKTTSLDQGNWEWDTVSSLSWSRFWVIIYPDATDGPWTVEDDWGDATLWDGGNWGAETGFGMTSTQGDVDGIRTIIRDWKPGGTTCEWIIIAFDPASFDPSSPEPSSGDHETYHKYVGGVAVPARLATARYWRGTEAGTL